MDKINFLQLFGEIDDKIVRQANSVLNLYQESQEGVSFRADYSRRSLWKTVIASVAFTAAAMFGVFVLLLNVGKIRLGGGTEQSGHGGSPVSSDIGSASSETVDRSESSDSREPVMVSIHLMMYWNDRDSFNKLTDQGMALKDEKIYSYFADCPILENCTVKVKGKNNFPDKQLEFSSTGRIDFKATTNETLIGFEAEMTVIDPEKPARAIVNIYSYPEDQSGSSA